jgi:outer membrane protein assembly factor BamD
MKNYRQIVSCGIALLIAGLMAGCSLRAKKYENPITKDTQQPDKVLFDKAIADLEHGHYEVARLTLQSMINTYDQSEYLAKAKLAIADSWFREGGTHGWAQAEAEYKDFELFYPLMEESAEAQEKVCMIEYKQMEKSDRDPSHALHAETECRTLLTQYPNSKFAPQGQQLLRNIQEVLAEAEFKVGTFYRTKGVFYAAANRLQGLTDHFPLYSQADVALWELGDSYGHLGKRFRDRSAEAYAKIVREYPLSPYAADAKKKLIVMEKTVPEPDPAALARQKYERDNREKIGTVSQFWGTFKSQPEVRRAAKSGAPEMESLHPTVPVTVQMRAEQQAAAAAAANADTSSDVSASTITGKSALDTRPDARPAANQAQPAAAAPSPTPVSR